jgi:ABC-type phosphate transport system substrate-binding protein
MKLSTRVAAVTAGLGLAFTGLGLGTAFADPNGDPQFRQFAGVGSDTTEEVMQALSDVVVVNGTKVLGSYNATGSTPIKTKANGCEIPRPNGSGQGRTALQTSLSANGGQGDGCVQFARSSSARGSFTSPAGQPKLAYVPFARDAVAFSVTATSNIPRKLTLTQLQAIYRCTETGGGTYRPLLPQNGSGTRSFWIEKMYGSATANLADFPCVVDNAGQEHDGRILDDNSIVPFSIAQYIAQAGGTSQDKRGRAVLGQVDNNQPILLNGNYSSLTRNVYNIIPEAATGLASDGTTRTITNAEYAQVFGTTGQICTGAGLSTIQQFGFGAIGQCGTVENIS